MMSLLLLFAIIIRENSIAGLGLTNDLLAITQKYFLFLLLPQLNYSCLHWQKGQQMQGREGQRFYCLQFPFAINA